ncbi:lytic transglycosylase domain-containing protein [Phyllobacterium endophyticum]|nr:lytic transglycosylase domain-containing protein [Phyllobacterium endophyticum]
MSASMSSFSALTRVKSIAQEPTKTTNIIYSNQTLHSVVPECGPSPLSPTEIEALVGATAAGYAIDPRFAKAIAWAESRYDQVRNSPKGARGPMQLMPSIAAALGVQDPCEPKSNVDGGVRYLKALIDEFQNPLLAAAAYNAGSQAVYDNGGIPPYGETIRYVATVINHQLGIERVQGKASSRRAIAMRDGGGSSAQASGDSSRRGSRFVKGGMHF